jgi:hypothetical protein
MEGRRLAAAGWLWRVKAGGRAMPRLTPEELREARRRKGLERQRAREEAERRMAEEKERLEYLKETQLRRQQVGSVLDGLYDEIDKLTRKAPADEITELALRRVNGVIVAAKDLLKGDPFIDTIDPFVAAGEYPEHRDVLIILREIRQGMQRQEQEYVRLQSRRR